MTEERGMAASASGPGEDFFDPAFLAELEELAAIGSGRGAGTHPGTSGLHQKLSAFLTPSPGLPGEAPLSEAAFVSLPTSSVVERTNALIEICSQGRREAVQAVANFVVFFQALVPTLSEEGSREIKRAFFRLVPTLIHVAFNDFSDAQDKRQEGIAALRNLETILIELSNVRLAPSESELVFRSIDQMAAFIGVAEYAMASEIICSRLLSIISRNKLMRALFRLMEVEVSVQRYLKERLGYATPRIRLPDDVACLAEYGPIRILHEESRDGASRRFIQFQIPDMPILSDVVLHLVSQDTPEERDLRLDALGSAELSVPDGTYALGLLYQPGETSRPGG